MAITKDMSTKDPDHEKIFKKNIHKVHIYGYGLLRLSRGNTFQLHLEIIGNQCLLMLNLGINKHQPFLIPQLPPPPPASITPIHNTHPLSLHHHHPQPSSTTQQPPQNAWHHFKWCRNAMSATSKGMRTCQVNGRWWWWCGMSMDMLLHLTVTALCPAPVSNQITSPKPLPWQQNRCHIIDVATRLWTTTNIVVSLDNHMIRRWWHNDVPQCHWHDMKTPT